MSLIDFSISYGSTIFDEIIPIDFRPSSVQVSISMENNAVQFGTFHIDVEGQISCFCPSSITTGGNYINTTTTYICQ